MNTTTLEKQKTITHISTVRTEGIITRIHVMQVLGLDDLQYGQIVHESGMAFLQDMYTDFDEKWIDKLATLKAFWTWWKSEWLIWEQALLMKVAGHEHSLTIESYKTYMTCTGESMLTLNSFGNFLKICKDVEL